MSPEALKQEICINIWQELQVSQTEAGHDPASSEHGRKVFFNLAALG